MERIIDNYERKENRDFWVSLDLDTVTQAAALADRLEEQGCTDDAELVRRLAGL